MAGWPLFGGTSHAGPQGPAGPAGAVGSQGPAGEDGVVGSPGATGATGVTGKTGATGFSGFTKTLPVGETETGVWLGVVGPNALFGNSLILPISFPIPLAAPLPGIFDPVNHTLVITSSSTAGDKEKCDNGSGAAPGVGNPEADSGFLCVFVAEGPTISEAFVFRVGEFASGASPAGARLIAAGPEEGEVVEGSFAVTG